MKRAVLFTFFLFPTLLFSQHLPDSLRNWHRGGNVGLNFTQSTFTNWAAGGENSLSGQALLGLYLNYKKDSTVFWDNNLDLAYGMLKQNRNLMRKTDDKIDFTSKYGHYAFKKVWFYSALFGFKTQFIPGYTYQGDTAKTLIADFMAPAYSLFALGLDYRPNAHFSLLIAPITAKTTIVNNQQLADAGAFGVEKAQYDAAGNKTKDGQHIRNEFGGYIRAQYSADVMKNVNLKARFEIFSNYLKTPQNLDLNAEVLVTMKVNKFLSASIAMQGIYDNDIMIAYDNNNDGVMDGVGPRFQFRQVLAIGFSTKF